MRRYNFTGLFIVKLVRNSTDQQNNKLRHQKDQFGGMP